MKNYLNILVLTFTLLSMNACVMRNGEIKKISFTNSAIENMQDVEEQRNNFLKNVFFVEKFAEKNNCKTFHCFARVRSMKHNTHSCSSYSFTYI